VLPQAPYSPDLAPASNYCLFPLKAHRFQSVEGLKEAMMVTLKVDAGVLTAMVQLLEEMYDNRKELLQRQCVVEPNVHELFDLSRFLPILN
jgi:hypothetical protein